MDLDLAEQLAPVNIIIMIAVVVNVQKRPFQVRQLLLVVSTISNSHWRFPGWFLPFHTIAFSLFAQRKRWTNCFNNNEVHKAQRTALYS